MNDDRTVIGEGIVYIEGDSIVAVLPKSENAPAGFTKSEAIKVGGTIYPGMIELHNHLCYNVLPQWIVPKLYTNRNQWRNHKDYSPRISTPVRVLGSTERYGSALVKFVECKCLMSGTTTSQGITLQSNQGIKKYFKGVVRNVEAPILKSLKPADTKIQDVEAAKLASFRKKLKKSSCLLLHLSEGVDAKARSYFTTLRDAGTGEWAITDALAGIHANGLNSSDLAILKNHGGSVVWSPLSNFMLYGQSLDIKTAKNLDLLLALGSDWSPTGSKNLLCELKVAKIASDSLGGVFSDEELVAMTSLNPAKILKWDQKIGSIEKGKLADLLVVKGQQGDPYLHLIEVRETDISAVVIGGIPRCGTKTFMEKFDGEFEEVAINANLTRVLNSQNDADNPFPDLTLAEAISRLQEGLSDISGVALGLASGTLGFMSSADEQGQMALWSIVPDEDDHEDLHVRHHIGTTEPESEVSPFDLAAFANLAEGAVPLDLDDLLIAQSSRFFKDLVQQKNVFEPIIEQLPKYYGVDISIPDDGAERNFTDEVKNFLKYVKDISHLSQLKGQLTDADKLLIVRQGMNILENAFVHMPLKQNLHAANPIARLKVLEYKIENKVDPRFENELEFHLEMVSIFNSLRDLHTNYILPTPFRDKFTFLPFFIEECFEQPDEPVYIISRIMPGAETETFQPGVRVLFWNGIPIEHAIRLNADRNAGSNLAAQVARGLDALTFRPLMRLPPPEEEWVELTYLDEQDKERSVRHRWNLSAANTDIEGWFRDGDGWADGGYHFGFDHLTDTIQQIKKLFFSAIAEQIQQIKARNAEEYSTNLPGFFRVKKLDTPNGPIGYIRIFSFNISNEDLFVAEIINIIQWLGEVQGIILDVRGNGGGNIRACENALRLFSSKPIAPHRAQFLDSDLTRFICKKHSPSKFPGLDLSVWNQSLEKLTMTGEQYSLAYPISEEKKIRTIRQQFKGPVVLIVDALCYSATDIFASGFKDHELGRVLGTSDNIGAGGANVWRYQDLLQLTLDEGSNKSDFFEPLPLGASFRVSIRRILKEKKDRGLVLEDLGLVPDERHFMTKKDLLEGNADLIEHASDMLNRMNG